MPYEDLRSYLQTLEQEGELRRIKAEVDWNLEIGAITRRAMELCEAAPLFEQIAGYPSDYRVFGNVISASRPFSHGRFALALDLPRDTPTLEVIEAFGQKTEQAIKPCIVPTGPCKEQIYTGDAINLYDFPAPLLRALDGGRYIGTWHVDVTRDPQTGWVNWGTYRHMIHDQRTIGIMAHPAQHGPAVFYQRYEPFGQAMPIAIAIGTDPICNIVAGTQFPYNTSEVEIAGGMRGEPVELVRCETVDLEVPATAEIILEGELLPHERRLEGPFGEYTGYSASQQVLCPVIRLSCITHRRHPILTINNPGKPGDTVFTPVKMSAMFTKELRRRGIPFRALYVPPSNTTVIIAANIPYPGFAHTLAAAIWASKPGVYRPYVVVVGEDVDVTNIEEVFWCLFTRLHPATGIHVQKGTPSQPLIPFLTPQERQLRTGAKVLLDATFPSDWPPEARPVVVDFEGAWPQEVKDRVRRRWQEYGFT